jgi:hypothetical protein
MKSGIFINLGMILLLLFSNQAMSEWKYNKKTDFMTDIVSHVASVKDNSGHLFSLYLDESTRKITAIFRANTSPNIDILKNSLFVRVGNKKAVNLTDNAIYPFEYNNRVYWDAWDKLGIYRKHIGFISDLKSSSSLKFRYIANNELIEVKLSLKNANSAISKLQEMQKGLIDKEMKNLKTTRENLEKMKADLEQKIRESEEQNN